MPDGSMTFIARTTQKFEDEEYFDLKEEDDMDEFDPEHEDYMDDYEDEENFDEQLDDTLDDEQDLKDEYEYYDDLDDDEYLEEWDMDGDEDDGWDMRGDQEVSDNKINVRSPDQFLNENRQLRAEGT